MAKHNQVACVYLWVVGSSVAVVRKAVLNWEMLNWEGEREAWGQHS